jgi:group I intron endonuclease
MKAFIYKITNPKGKIYIGSTVNLTDRKYRYKTNRVKEQVKISRSIQKYGWDNHLFEVIFICGQEERFYFENKFGKKFDVLGPNGLNLSLPKQDDILPCMSDETRLKLSKARKGIKMSEEFKKNISKISKEWHKNNPHPMKGAIPWNKGKVFLAGELNPMYGVKRSDEWKAKQSSMAKLKNLKADKHFKSKIVFDKTNGIYYTNAKEASDLLNIKYSTLKCFLNGARVNKTNLMYV